MKLFRLSLGLLLSPALFAAVGNQDLQDIRTLVSQGKYEEALQKHLWFHEESKTSRGMGGVRLSFALSQWVELGAKYPKALAALEQIRADHEKQLLAGAAGFPEFHEYHAISRTLKEEQKTYTLFAQLHATQPAIAQRCFDVSLDLIVKHGNYELCANYLGDPITRYERIQHLREVNLGLMKKSPQMNTPRFAERADRGFVEKTVQLIDILVNLKRLDEAREIQKRALAYLPAPEIEKSVPRA